MSTEPSDVLTIGRRIVTGVYHYDDPETDGPSPLCGSAGENSGAPIYRDPSLLSHLRTCTKCEAIRDDAPFPGIERGEREKTECPYCHELTAALVPHLRGCDSK